MKNGGRGICDIVQVNISPLRPRTRLHDIVSRISFKNPPFPIRMEVSQTTGEARIIITVPSRDDGRSVEVNHPTGFFVDKVELFPCDDSFIERRLSSEVQRVFVHEARECYHFDGLRVDDPHQGGW